MNVQSTRVMPVNQTVAEQVDRERPPLISAAIDAGKAIGFLAAARACTMAGRIVDKVISKEIPGSLTFRPKPEFYYNFGSAVGSCLVGVSIAHGVSAICSAAKSVQSMGYQLSSYLVESAGFTPLAQESRAIKACACFGALWSVFAGHGLMHSLVGITNPFPDSVPCRVVTLCSKEVINASILAAVGAGTGYLAGKGVAYAVEKACAGIDMVGRGVESIFGPDVMIEPG